MDNLNSILSGSLIFREKGNELSRITPSTDAIEITGSLRVKGNNILLNGSDLAYRITTLEAGQGADQIAFGNIALWTGSMNEWSASTKGYIDNINDITASFNAFTASENIITSNLETTASRLDITASNHESRLDYIEGKPLVSSSAQIYNLGFLTSSIQGIVSSSEQIWDLGFITASRWSEILEIPQGIISSSQQIDDLFNLDGIVSASNGVVQLQDTDLQVTGSFHLELDGVTKYFSINVNGEDKVKVNEEGILQLFSQSISPTAVEGGIYYGNDYSLYLGVNQ